MADTRSSNLSAVNDEVQAATPSVDPNGTSQDMELVAPGAAAPEFKAAEDATRSKLRIIAIVTALYVCILATQAGPPAHIFNSLPCSSRHLIKQLSPLLYLLSLMT